ncbi:MAG: hypothetical protein CVU87_03035 [Firmicutes bacterium HGW-Firmicutes-12]|jgi:hypothetical protein|nr:MAG: hypothetical protein CVU87_03035 [Firmicutes bacterium HGW-Firmicutes-12]
MMSIFRKLLYPFILVLVIAVSACTFSPFPLEIKTDDTLKVIKKGADFRIYAHKRGYILLKSFESNQDSLSLFNKLKESGQDFLKSNISISSKVIDNEELGFDLKMYSINEYRPIIVGENNIYGVIAEIETNEDKRYRELIVFSSEGRGYFLYYISDIKNNILFQVVKNISLIDSQSVFGDDISADITITVDHNLGQDKDGKPYIIVYKKKDQIVRAARQKEPDKEMIGIFIEICSNNKDIKEATIDVMVELDGDTYKNNGNAYFSLEPQEICEYKMLLPIDKDVTKTNTSYLTDTMKIILRYKENGVEISKVLKEGKK